MATFVLEDLAAAIEVMVFPKTMLLNYGELLDADAIVAVKARAEFDATTRPSSWRWRSPVPSCISDGGVPPLTLRVSAGAARRRSRREPAKDGRTHPGHSQVCLCRIVGPE